MFLLDRTWDATRDMERLRSEIDHLFSGVSGRVHEHPPVNVWVNEKGAVLTAELPGVLPTNLDIAVLADTVTLRGERAPLKLAENETLHRNERPAGRFSRTLKLPFRVDAPTVEATFRNGVLTIHLPRAQADQARRIEVKTERA